MGGERYEPLEKGSPDAGRGLEGLEGLELAEEGEAPPSTRSRAPGLRRAAAALGATLVGALLVAGLALRSGARPGRRGAADVGGAVVLSEGKHCHTAVPGEECYKDVSWAITDGIYAHPEWYFGLTEKSSFEAFQAVVYKVNSTMCPLPCNIPKNEHKDEDEDEDERHKHTSEADVDEKESPDHHSGGARTQEHSDSKAEAACHTAVEGDPCFKAVRWAMTDGIKQNPSWYEGLDEHSSFEEFQAKLHETSETNCPKPCVCKTSVRGDTCHEHVLWVLKTGIKTHPEWYEGLSQQSRFEDVQLRLHEDAQTMCEKPCMPRFFGTPSLFCFSVFQSTGYEPDLMKAQLKKRVGIFSCDEFAVIADAKISLGQGPYGEVETLVIPHTTVGISKDNTAANTLIFIHAWQRVYDDFRFSHHDWTLKVDPDAVINVASMRVHLMPHTGKKVYVKNCNKYPGSPNWPMMFGSLEAISQSAIWAYMEGADRCRNELQWEAWGEDLYLAECLDLLGCGNVHDYDLISDKVCLGVDCSNKNAAAFHAFKGTEEWFQCWHTVFD